MWRLIVLVCTLFSAVSSRPDRILHESRGIEDLDETWARNVISNRNVMIPVRIGLVQSNLERGYDHVLRISDPSSSTYGRHWSKDEVDREFAADQVAVDHIKSWLVECGISDIKITANWVSFDAPLKTVEWLLRTKYYEFEREGVIRIGCDSYSLPKQIAPLVDYITPGVNYSPPMHKAILTRGRDNAATRNTNRNFKRMRVSRRDEQEDLKHCDKKMTPPCYRALYGLPQPSQPLPKNDLAIFQTGDSQYYQKNLDEHFTSFASYVPNGTHPELVSINGATAPAKHAGGASGEANLDFMVAYGLLGPVNITLYQVGVPKDYKGNYYNNGALVVPLLDAVDGSFCNQREKDVGFDCGTAKLSKVVSMSFGVPELYKLSAAKQKRICNEFMKLALQGHTIIASSGDFGVSTTSNYGHGLGIHSNGCVPQDLKNTGKDKFNGTIFVPDFPATCPYVLGVGATQLEPGQTVADPESAMNFPPQRDDIWSKLVTWSSGGGFSNYFARPQYQDEMVSRYFQDHDPGYKTYNSNGVDVKLKSTNIGSNGGIYNKAGRGFPDVSANGVNFPEYWDTYFLKDRGTSVAAPVWASVIALLNAERAAIGKGSVGFVQPVLYKHPEVFHDIRNGTNGPGCRTDGFAAVDGWDPVTGLGTPNWTALKKLFLSLP